MKPKRSKTPCGLADYLAAVNRRRLCKRELAPILASVATRLYALSIPNPRQRIR